MVCINSMDNTRVNGKSLEVKERSQMTHVATTRPTVVRKSRSLYEVESASKSLVTWRVSVDHFGNMTCTGNSEGERCWPFYQHTECKHTRAVLMFIKANEPVQVVVRKRVPLRPMHALVGEPVKVGTVVSEVVPCGLSEIFGFD